MNPNHVGHFFLTVLFLEFIAIVTLITTLCINDAAVDSMPTPLAHRHPEQHIFNPQQCEKTTTPLTQIDQFLHDTSSRQDANVNKDGELCSQCKDIWDCKWQDADCIRSKCGCSKESVVDYQGRRCLPFIYSRNSSKNCDMSLQCWNDFQECTEHLCRNITKEGAQLSKNLGPAIGGTIVLFVGTSVVFQCIAMNFKDKRDAAVGTEGNRPITAFVVVIRNPELATSQDSTDGTNDPPLTCIDTRGVGVGLSTSEGSTESTDDLNSLPTYDEAMLMPKK